MRDPAFVYAAVVVVAALLSIPFLAVKFQRKRWIRNWLIGLPYLSLFPVALAVIALEIDVRIFSSGISAETFASAIAILIAWFAVPIGAAAFLNRRWQ